MIWKRVGGDWTVHRDIQPRERWDERFGSYDSDLALFLAAPVLEQEVAR